MSVKIDVVGDYIYENSDNGVLDNWIKINTQAVRSNSVRDMVNKVIAKSAGGGQIQSLRIFAHGAPGAQWVAGGFGSKDAADAVRKPAQAIYLNGVTLQNQNVLAPLCNKFEPAAVVELHGCEVGKGVDGKNLCIALAKFWNVIVRAGTDLQYADAANVFESGYIQAYPSGRVIQFAKGSSKFMVIALATPKATPAPPAAAANDYQADYPVNKAGIMLSNVSNERYKTFEYWPLIYDDNRAQLPNGPNKVPLNIKLKIRKPEKFTAAELAHARKHWKNWQTYR